MRSLHLLTRRMSGLLVIDLQEKLLPVVPQGPRLVWNAGRLLRAAQLFDVPAAATVQYPKGLGSLVPELRDALPAPHEKLHFSAAIPAIHEWRSEHELVQLVVCGIETHVCVLQSAMDLLASGADVYIPVDAVGARSELDHRTALDRLQACGATLTTVESVLFEWCETAADPQFKALSALIREQYQG